MSKIVPATDNGPDKTRHRPRPTSREAVQRRKDRRPVTEREEKAPVVHQAHRSDEAANRKAPPAGRKRKPKRRSAPAGGAYDVGYGKPPRHTRFKKGVSGNPNGRPKKSRNLKSILQEHLDSPVIYRGPEGQKRITTREGIVKRLIDSGLKGNLQALKKLLELDEQVWAENITTADDGSPETPTRPDELRQLDEMVLAMYTGQICQEGDSANGEGADDDND